MTEVRAFFKQSSQYVLGQVLIVVAGFLSFPILTRVLSVSEYGILSLIASTIFIMLAVSKLGMNHSAIRYYEEFRGGKRTEPISHFYSTLFIGSLVFTTAAIALFAVIYEMMPKGMFDPRFSELLIFLGILVFLRSIHGILRVFIRAEQRTVTWNAVLLAQKYGTIGLGLLCFFCVVRSLRGYYLGQAVAESIVIVYLLYDLYRKTDIRWKYFSREFFGESIRYGIPMLGVEAFGLLTSHTDRYLIQYFREAYDLGIYSVATNMVGYVALILSVPMELGLMPICMGIWVKKGEEATREFLGETLRYFCLIAFPVTLGFISIGEEVTVLLASEKYARSCHLIPYLMVGSMVLAGMNIFAVPILLKKKTEELAMFFFLAVVGSLALNVVMIPRFGVFGAAYVRVIVYVTLFVLVAAWSARHHLRIKIDLRSVMVYLVGAFTMYLAIDSLKQMGPPVVDILFKICFGAAIYGAFVVCFDRKVRGNAGNVVRRMKENMSGSVRE